MSVLHFSYASDGGASRAGRRLSLACRAAGLSSSFAFIEGKPVQSDDVCVTSVKSPAARGGDDLAKTLSNRFQWEFIPDRRTAVSNSLLSIPYPGVDVAALKLFDNADIIHLHWPTWGVTPRAISNWLSQGKVVFWTLHDMWAMTGGCHYSAGCYQYESVCMKCPQLTEDFGLVGNSFEEKLGAYGQGGQLMLLSPSHWLAEVAKRSRILGSRRIDVVRNPIELDIFKPSEDREALRRAFGIGPEDFVLMMGSGDLKEKRKGVDVLLKAIRALVDDGSLADALPRKSKINLILIGKSGEPDLPPEIQIMNFGEIKQDQVLVDVYSIADVVAIPSLEDNYPNMIVEAMACGTPIIGFDTGGIPEMIDDGVTGLVVRPPGSVSSLEESIVEFAERHFRSEQMRAACRASAEATGNPEDIGIQLRNLYEEALGRPIEPVNADLHARVLGAYANAPAGPDVRVGPSMLRFPANLAVLSRSEDATNLRKAVITPLAQAKPLERGRSLLSVRTYHEHHSGRSGPYQFLRHLPKNGYSASHFAVPLGGELATRSAELFRKAGALMGAGAFGQQGNAWLAEAEILFECAQRRVDIVHFIDGELGGMFLPSAPDYAFHGGRRPLFVATYHQPEDVLRGMVNLNLLARFDGIVALCEPQRDFLATLISEDKIAIIPHGIDVDFFSPAPGGRSAPNSAKRRLLMVGHWLRDIKVAVAAYNQLKLSEFEFELRVVSPRFTANVSDPSITLLKGISDEDLREEYRSADLLYLPLMDATANNAVLEAMACGLPVVSTAVGGVPEAVGREAGILCERGDAKAFARGVLQLLRSPEQYAACSAGGRRRAEALSWSRIGAMHHEFYERLARSKRRVERPVLQGA